MTLLLIAKATVMLALALAIVATLRRATAATRHAVLVAAQVGVLLLPLLPSFVPSVVVSEDVVAVPGGLKPAAPQRVADAAALPVWPMVYFGGVVLFAAIRTVGYLRAMAVVRRATRWRDVLLSDEVAQPMTFGAAVLLPREATSWSTEKLQAVLLHERAHVTRRDTWVQLIADAASAMYWFHPLVWLASRRMRFERERACDDLALANGLDATEYAAALVGVARATMHPRAALAMAERSQLAARVHAVLDAGVRRRTMRGARVASFAAMLAIAPLLAAIDVDDIPRPRFGEPDLRNDAVAKPWSEHIGVAATDVIASGRDAAPIAYLQQLAQHRAESEVDFVADRARWALTRVRDGELVATLIASLHDRDWRVRAYAAWSLGVAADRRATAPLVELLDDDIWRVRAAAASSLHALADPAAAPAMRRALGDDAWQVRSQAVAFFAEVGAERKLFETMRRDRHIAVRWEAEEALQ